MAKKLVKRNSKTINGGVLPELIVTPNQNTIAGVVPTPMSEDGVSAPNFSQQYLGEFKAPMTDGVHSPFTPDLGKFEAPMSSDGVSAPDFGTSTNWDRNYYTNLLRGLKKLTATR